MQLGAALDAPDLGDHLTQLVREPAFYVRLREGLARYRVAADNGGWGSIPAGAKLVPGVRDRASRRCASACAPPASTRGRPPPTPGSTTRVCWRRSRPFKEGHGLSRRRGGGRPHAGRVECPGRQAHRADSGQSGADALGLSRPAEGLPVRRCRRIPGPPHAGGRGSVVHARPGGTGGSPDAHLPRPGGVPGAQSDMDGAADDPQRRHPAEGASQPGLRCQEGTQGHRSQRAERAAVCGQLEPSRWQVPLYPAAGWRWRQGRAGKDQVHVPQPLLRLSPRHAEPAACSVSRCV